MLLFVTILHFIVAFLLIVLVLIQDSKGGGVFGMGSAGGSNQVFSATGAANFLVKATRVLGVMFAVTCISLTYLTTHKGQSVIDGYVAPAATTPAATDAPAAATPAPTEAPAAAAPATENTAPQKPESK